MIRRALAHPTAPLAWGAAWAWLAWRQAFVCDDAYITFRYAHHAARGLGPVYNPGDWVEGYSHPLWMGLAAVCEAAGLSSDAVLPWVSAACGLALLALVVRVAQALGLGPWGTHVAAATVALSPAVATWSTGGLATMPAALAVFALAERLFVARDGRGGALVAALLVLLRTEGALWVAGLGAVAWVLGAPGGRRAARTVLVAGLTVTLAHLAVRVGLYGDVFPQPVHAKVGLGPDRLLRGLRYVAGLGVRLGVPVLAAAAWPALAARRDARGFALAGAAALAFPILVGGDYMPYGRLLVAAVPFGALALGAVAHRPTVAALVVGLAAVGTLPLFGTPLAPPAVRQALASRQNYAQLDTEQASWRFMRHNVARWSRQGRAMQAAAPPGFSVVTGAIGARGYHAPDVVILDRGGLVTRPPPGRSTAGDVLEASPGHDLMLARRAFLPLAPDALDFAVLPRQAPARARREAMAGWRRFARDGYRPTSVDVVVDDRALTVWWLARGGRAPPP